MFRLLNCCNTFVSGMKSFYKTTISEKWEIEEWELRLSMMLTIFCKIRIMITYFINPFYRSINFMFVRKTILLSLKSNFHQIFIYIHNYKSIGWRKKIRRNMLLHTKYSNTIWPDDTRYHTPFISLLICDYMSPKSLR